MCILPGLACNLWVGKNVKKCVLIARVSFGDLVSDNTVNTSRAFNNGNTRDNNGDIVNAINVDSANQKSCFLDS